MSKHIDAQIQAYFDGELNGKNRKKAEAHLKDCDKCQQGLNELSHLSSILQADLKISQKANSDKFVSQVMWRLPRKVRQTWWQKFGKTAYMLIPALLLLVLIFHRTTNFSNNLLLGADLLGIGEEEISTLLSAPVLTNVEIPFPLPTLDMFDAGGSMWLSLGNINVFGIDLSNSFIYPLIFGLLSISWMIGWWVTQEQKQKLKN